MKKNFLVLGSGAREHAIADKLLSSDFVERLFLADPNDGFAELGTKIDYTDFEDLARKAKKNSVDILVVGPENPLCEGITDLFKKHDIAVIGVDKHWSQLESSKHFAKIFMQKHGIKTASYTLVKTYEDIKLGEPPFVIKADGLCKGKGVAVIKDKTEATALINEYLNGKFGKASKTLLIEDFLQGEEFSLMSIWDGKNLLSFPPARDFKRINNDLESMNTGGMGAFCPVKLTNIQKTKLKEYERKLENALIAENADFTGFMYSGLIWNDDDFFVLEYNVRLGDPETQTILMILESDLGEIFINTVEGKLDKTEIKWSDKTAACLTIAAKGYPISPKIDEKITNLPPNSDRTKIFFAGVKKKEDGLYSSGGRVLSICSIEDLAFQKTMETADMVDMKGKYYRTDLHL